MGADILDSYYKGVLDKIQAEVNSINSLFIHNGLKGEGNEKVLLKFLKKFIPKRFGIDTGIIIDKDGNPSKQIDIIIYDNYNYPELLGLTSIKMFPIDIVYAVIEVKTRLTKQQSIDAIKNIESVRKLNIIKEKSTIIHQGYLRKDYQCTPPVGFIFGHSSNTNNNSTFLNWFKSYDIDSILCPGLICCLDQGLIAVNVYKDSRYKKFTPFLYPFIEKEDFITFLQKEAMVKINGKSWCNFRKQKLLPFITVGDKNMIIDQSKIFLNFILHLEEILRNKILNPNINFREIYLSEAMRSILINHNNKIVWRKEDYPQYSK